MRYLLLACDYDETLAEDGQVNDATRAALKRLLASGRKAVLLTGRELPDLLSIFPDVDLFERVVAENGALLYTPAGREEKLLAHPPAENFVEALREEDVQPLAVGRAIVATRQPHEAVVLDAIRRLGLELQVIFNKGAVMVLPAGINKATGLAAVLEEMGFSAHNVVGIGDAENDHAFLTLCECAAATANALPAIKERADLVTAADHGAAVIELIDELIGSDLRQMEGRLRRHHLLLGTGAQGEEVRIPPFRTNVLIAGPSGSGKSTAATSFLERLVEHKYQFCVIDPEGDYEYLANAVALGSSRQGPSVNEVLQLLQYPGQNAVVNLVGVPLADRPNFFLNILPHLQQMRARMGRPHWLVIDEAHHLLPSSWQPAPLALPQELDRMVLITVHPDQVAPSVVSLVDTVIAVGQSPDATIRQFCQAAQQSLPDMPSGALESGEVIAWLRPTGTPPFRLRLAPSRLERRRHSRKYVEGELPPERSFYFRGPQAKLNLRAQNLLLFIQLAEGVDRATWMYHLRRRDYSHWFRTMIKDESLAAEAARIESMDHLSAAESRALIRAAIEQHYTLPASSSVLAAQPDAGDQKGDLAAEKT